MALTLDETIRRQRVADALSSLDLGPRDLPTDTSDQDAAAEAGAEAETNRQLAEATAASKSDTPDVPKHVEDAYGDWKKWPTIASDQPAAPEPGTFEPPDVAPTVKVPTPPRPAEPLSPEYAGIDATEPKAAPMMEPITSESVVTKDYPAAPSEMRPPGHIDLGVPGHEDLGPPPAPDTLDQVERAQLVKLPAEAPDKLTQVERATLVKLPPQPAPDTLPQVEKALPTGPKAPGIHTELAPPGQMDLREDVALPATQPPATKPAVEQQPAIKPVAGDWRTWTTTDGTSADPLFTQSENKAPTSVDTLKAGEGNRVDPGQLFNYLQSKFADSGLVGYVPPDGARWGIKTGSAAEWAALGLAIAKQESDLNTRSYNSTDPGGSVGLFQFGQGQTQFTKGGNQFDPQESADAFVRSVQHYVAGKGNVANLGETFGSIRRPNEAGQYIGYAQEIAARDGAQQAAAQPKKEAWESWATLPQADADKAIQEAQVGTLQNIANKSTNLIGLYKQLDQPVENVQDPIRQEFQGRIKDQIIKLMQEREPNLSADDAWKKAQSDIGPLEVGADFWNKFVGSFQQFQPLLQQAYSVRNEQSHMNAFLDQALPNGSDADKQALLTKLYNTPREQRGALVQSLIPNPQTGVPGADPNEIVSALDRLSNPDYAKEQDKAMAKAKEDFRARMLTDPRLQGTGAEKAVDAIAQIPEMLAAAGFTPALAAQVSQQVRDQMKAEHPEYSEDELDQKQAYSTLVQIVGQEAAGRIMGAGMGAIIKGVKSPVQRAIAQALGNMGAGAATGAGTQALSNVVSGEQAGKGVPEAAIAGGLQGGVVGAVHGAGELGQRPIEPQPTTGKEGAPIRGAEDKTLEQPPQPVTAQSILGPDVPDTSMKWYDPTQPIVTRGTERTTFTPAELAEQAGTVTGKTPEELRAAAEKLQPPVDFNQRVTWFLGDEGTQETQQAQRAQAPSPPPTLAEAIRQQKAAADLERTTPQTVTPPQATGKLHPDNNIQVGVNPLTRNLQIYLYGKEGQRGALPLWDGVTKAEADALAENLRQRGTGGKYVDPGLLNKAFNRAREQSGQLVNEARETAINTFFRPKEAISSPPPRVGEADPYVSKIANRYTAERMATGELGPVDPSQGQSTEHMVMQGLKMAPEQRERLINNFSRGTGGDLDTQGAAIRSKEAILSEQSRSASRASGADPNNPQLKAQEQAALKELTDFHNGPVKKFKRVWSDSGRALQREIPIDYTTLNGIKEAYLKSNGKEAPAGSDPKFQKVAGMMSNSVTAEQAVMRNWGQEIEARTRGNPVTDESVRTRLMEIMKDLPCRT
jgi:hypothetical protein